MMTRRPATLTALVLASVLALGGCAKKSAPVEPPAPGQPPEVALAALLGPKPALLGPLSSLAQRTPIREAHKAAPVFFAPGIDDDTRDVTVPELPGIKLSVSVRCTTARGCRVGDWLILLPKAHALAALTRAWGAPVESTSSRGEHVRSWWNPTARLRARVERADGEQPDTTVRLSRYLPAVELLGDGATLAFEGGHPVFGRDIGEVMREHPEWRSGFSDVTQLDLPPTEYDDGDCTVELRTDDKNRVAGFSLDLGYGDDRTRDELRATLERRFGKAIQKGDTLSFTAPGRKIVARDDTKSRAWELTITPKR